MSLSNAEKLRRHREKLRTEKLRDAKDIKAIIAVRNALLRPPEPTVYTSSCGLLYYRDRKGIPLRYIRGYASNA